jgi:hypothetical protein
LTLEIILTVGYYDGIGFEVRDRLKTAYFGRVVFDFRSYFDGRVITVG